MSKFENRESQTLNYKILDVKSVERDESGEIILMKVEVIRNDTPNEGKEGTPLNAESLTAIIKDMIDAEIDNMMDYVFIGNEKLCKDLIKISLPEKTIVDFELPQVGKLKTVFQWSVPVNSGIEIENSIQTDQTVLKNMIRKTIFAVSIEENRPIFTGCLFEVVNNSLNVVAVDGFRMAWFKQDLENATSDFKAVIPGKTLNEVNKIILDSFDSIKIGVSKNQAIFEMENCKIVTRLLDGEFLNYASVIPNNWETRIRVNKNTIQNCFERISLISSSSIEKEKKYPVKIKIEVGKVTISCTNQTGDAKEEIYTETEGKDLEIGVNPKYFLDALKAVEDEEIFISFGTSISPCVIRPIDETARNYTYMILPIRMKEE